MTDDAERMSDDGMVERTADIVSAYVSHNNVPTSELAALIASVHVALVSLGGAATIAEAGPEKLTPAQIKKSITPDALVSFEDGKLYKTLRRHLNLRGLSPEAYRTKWGLPLDYPMTAATYSAERSKLARSLGLGRWGALGWRAAAAAGPTEPAVAEATDPAVAEPKTRGRRRKVEEQA